MELYYLSDNNNEFGVSSNPEMIEGNGIVSIIVEKGNTNFFPKVTDKVTSSRIQGKGYSRKLTNLTIEKLVEEGYPGIQGNIVSPIELTPDNMDIAGPGKGYPSIKSRWGIRTIGNNDGDIPVIHVPVDITLTRQSGYNQNQVRVTLATIPNTYDEVFYEYEEFERDLREYIQSNNKSMHFFEPLQNPDIYNYIQTHRAV